MNIVVVDGYTTNPGDLSWEGFEELGELSVYDRSARDELPARVADADIIVSNKVVWDAEALDWAPRAKMICLLSTGYNVVDVAECERRGIVVANVPAYSTPDVAQNTFALLLELCLHAGLHTRGVLDGKWSLSPDFCYWDTPLIELSGKTFGIVGMGSIGMQVASIARAFGMQVVFCNRSPKPELEEQGMRQLPLEKLLATSDIVSLHVPATPQTERLIDRDALALMKPHALLINTARGSLVDEAAVAEALVSGQLGGFAADVVSIEPMSADNPLLAAAQDAERAGVPLNVVFTPHFSWAIQEARKRLMAEAALNVKCFLEGAPRNIVVP